MSIKEAVRLGVMKQIGKNSLILKNAIEELGILLRYLKRVRKRCHMVGIELICVHSALAEGRFERKHGV